MSKRKTPNNNKNERNINSKIHTKKYGFENNNSRNYTITNKPLNTHFKRQLQKRNHPFGYTTLSTSTLTHAPNNDKTLFRKIYKIHPNWTKHNFNTHFKTYKSNDFIQQNIEPGIYTWIIDTNDNFYTSRIISNQELGSKHLNLQGRSIQNTDIYCAGELVYIPQNNTIFFNLQSGSFNKKIFIGNNVNSKYTTYINKCTDVIYKQTNIIPTFLKFDNHVLKNKVLLINNKPFIQFEINKHNADSTEKKAGRNIISRSQIITSNQNIGLYNSLLNPPPISTHESTQELTQPLD